MNTRLPALLTVLAALFFSPNVSAQLDCMGVDGGTALPGTPCDDGNEFTYSDAWDPNCVCVGSCYADWTLTGPPGSPCDDGFPQTVNDVWDEQCICSGTWVSDCIGIAGGPNLPGTPCDDGVATTLNDTWNWFCQCNGEEEELDCLGVLNGPDMPYSPCDDGDPGTINDMWNSDCDCLAWLNTVTGRLFLDVNTNGIYDAGDHLIYNQFVRFDTTFCPQSAFIGPTGEFQRRIPEGSYQLWTWSTADYEQVPSFMPLDIIGGGGDYPNTDLAMTPLQTQTDLAVGIQTWFSAPRPGFVNTVYTGAGNSGTVPTDGTFSFTFDPQQTYVNSWPVVGTVVGNTITWDLMELGLNQGQSFHVQLETPATVPIGTQINYSASVTSSLPDDVASNDQISISTTVVGSYDPNDKRVEPNTLTPQEIADGKMVEYTIRFQNTGTYLAENVRIEDHLPEGLDLTSLEFVASSHTCDITLDSTRLIFNFPQIMLPDSNANEPESHGFVMFRITPESDLQLGDAVENSAAIYFDYNEPVITEPAVFTVETNTGISDRSEDQLIIWPNPTNDLLNIQLKDAGNIQQIEIIDITGRPIRSESATSTLETIDVTDLASGNYIVRIHAEDRWFRSRFVKR